MFVLILRTVMQLVLHRPWETWLENRQSKGTNCFAIFFLKYSVCFDFLSYFPWHLTHSHFRFLDFLCIFTDEREGNWIQNFLGCTIAGMFIDRPVWEICNENWLVSGKGMNQQSVFCLIGQSTFSFFSKCLALRSTDEVTTTKILVVSLSLLCFLFHYDIITVSCP